MTLRSNWNFLKIMLTFKSLFPIKRFFPWNNCFLNIFSFGHISPLFNQCVSVIQQKNFMFSWISLESFMPKISNPGEGGSWNNFLKKTRSEASTGRQVTLISSAVLMFWNVFPLFLGRDSLSFSSYSTCLHQIQAELQHHVAYQRYTPLKQTWNLKMGAPWKRRFLLETIIFQVPCWISGA